MANDGTLSCGQLQEIHVELESKWQGNTYSDTSGIVKDGTIAALLQEQTASFSEIQDNTAKNQPDVKLTWLESCPVSVEESCSTSCTKPTTGTEFGDNCQTVTVDQCIQANRIKIDEHAVADTKWDVEEFIARAIFEQEKAIVEELNRVAIGTYDANANANLYTDTWGGEVTPAASDGDCTALSSAIWTDPHNYFTMLEALNNFTNPYYVGGQAFAPYALSQARAMAVANGTSFNGEGLVEIDGRRNYFDIRAFDAEILAIDGSSPNKMFVANRGEFALANKHYYPEAANRKQFDFGSYGYRMRSARLSEYLGQDVYFDIDYNTSCDTSSNVKRMLHFFDMKLWYKIVKSPQSCSGDSRVLCLSCT